MKTLIVDDDPVMVEIISALLSDSGFESFETAGDGAAALERLIDQTFELMICDLNMPGMDGVRLMSMVASLAVTPAVILLSGEDPRVLDVSRQFAEAKGLTILGVLSKPVDFDALMAVVHRYHPTIRQPAADACSVVLTGERIRSGIAAAALHLAYQPKVNLRSGQIVGAEALLRWRDEELGWVAAPAVVQAAEQASLIDELTLAVLSRAVCDHASLLRMGVDINFAFNVSMHNLHNLSIIDQMSAIVAKADDQPQNFTLEVTETHLMDKPAHVLEALIRSRLQGFKVAIDDYGAGAAAMQFLAQLPSTEMKIDRSFVSAAPRSEHGRVLLQSAIDLGLRLGQIVTAEGVETEAEASLALELGCHLGQGYFYGRPMSLDELIRRTSTRPAVPTASG
ncbi:EAL domain-containing response regulator [Lysobacter capsici]|uniref:EAL domain-containing response regulator n=1 Tax=Lysobacter capsici TaxID=435897 RepID=UPI0007164320|nr:EAL domain-containing protein [Lysobacter capsici]